MTTDNQMDPINQVEQDQAGIDQEQQVTQDTAPALTAVQVQQMMSAQLGTVTSQVNGLASKLDKGLNAIRRDTQAYYELQLRQQQDQAMENALSVISDPEERAQAEQNLRKLSQQQTPTAMPQPVVEEQPSVGGVTQNDVAQLDAFIQTFGLNPYDARLTGVKAMALDVTQPVGQRQKVLLDTLTSLRNGQPQPAQPPAASQPQSNTQPPAQQQQAQDPPMEAPGRPQAINSPEDVLDAYNRDELSKDEAVKRLGALGASEYLNMFNR